MTVNNTECETPELKYVNFRVPYETWKEMKISALVREMTLTEYFTEAHRKMGE